MIRGGDGRVEGARAAASHERGPMRGACAALTLGLLLGVAVGRRRRGGASRIAGPTVDVAQRGERVPRPGAAAAATPPGDGAGASAATTDPWVEIGHEITTPLNALLGAIDRLAASDRLPPDLLRHAEAARTAGGALRAIVDDLPGVSGIEAGRIHFRRAPFSLAALVGSCLSLARGEAAAKGLDLRHTVEDGLPPILVGDEARLRRVLLAVLGHAIRRAPGGAITVSVLRDAGTWPAARGAPIRFAVAQAGGGLPADERRASVGGCPGSAGPGLATVARLVEAMGGSMLPAPGVEDGAGTAFIVPLPRGVAPAGLAAIPPVGIASRRGRLLLAEDLPINQQLARVVLEAAGHAVDVVDDGAAAVAAVAAGAYDLVLMDVRMPGMDGVTAARAIRALPGPAAGVPILAMTANVAPEEIHGCLAAGMNDHVGKPFDRGALYAQIDRWLHDDRPATVPADGREGAPGIGPPTERGPAQDAFDRRTFEGVVALLGVDDTCRLLGQLDEELRRSLHGPSESRRDRARLRREAHVLVSAAGMLGLTGLRAACVHFETCDPDAPTFPGELAALRVRIEAAKRDAGRLAEALRPGARSIGGQRG